MKKKKSPLKWNPHPTVKKTADKDDVHDIIVIETSDLSPPADQTTGDDDVAGGIVIVTS
jgi:hypothetical protein